MVMMKQLHAEYRNSEFSMKCIIKKIYKHDRIKDPTVTVEGVGYETGGRGLNTRRRWAP
jgi:hypothetical protein